MVHERGRAYRLSRLLRPRSAVSPDVRAPSFVVVSIFGTRWWRRPEPRGLVSMPRDGPGAMAKGNAEMPWRRKKGSDRSAKDQPPLADPFSASHLCEQARSS